MKKYKQLTLEQRYQIYALLKAGQSRAEIGGIIGVHKSTVTRELKRNRSKRGYRPQYADKQALERRAEKAGPRIPLSAWTEIEAEIKKYSSPDQVSGKRRSMGQYPVSHEWIYQHIYRDKLRGGDLHTYLRCRKKRRKRYGSYSKRGVWKNQISIDQRPLIVE